MKPHVGRVALANYAAHHALLLLPIMTSALILVVHKRHRGVRSRLIFGRPANIYVLTTEIYRAINVTASSPNTNTQRRFPSPFRC